MPTSTADAGRAPIAFPLPGSPAPGFGGQPSFGPVVTASVPPPPLSGGTLLVARDGGRVFASDPDRDRIYGVDLNARALAFTTALASGDEPGRLVEDGAGRLHVVLRRGGAVVTLDPNDGALLGRRAICSAPRGIDFDAAAGLLHVACAGGDLVAIPPDPAAPVARAVQVDRDLRDVVVRGDRLIISRFRSAEVLVVDRQGAIVQRLRPPRTDAEGKPLTREAVEEQAASPFVAGGNRGRSPAVAWRLVPRPAGGVFMVHQRGSDDTVSATSGGYGGVCGGIVESVVSEIEPGSPAAVGASMLAPGAVLPIDAALHPRGRWLALLGAGNALEGRPIVPQVQMLLEDGTPAEPSRCMARRPPLAPPDGGRTLPPDAGALPPEPPPPLEYRQPAGEAIAVAFTPTGDLLAQSRQPATLQFLTGPATSIVLSDENRADTGHAVFHSNSGAGLACASCHPEGGDDGRVWAFAKIGARRTQSLRGGILDTAPFHWDGDMRDLGHLMREVFTTRMQGPSLSAAHVQALSEWIERIPALPRPPITDASAVERGSLIFNDASLGCASCHAGPALTNNATVDVGTGAPLQVPSLRGLVWRAPFMHDGCAPDLAGRFAACGGDDRHGVTSRLTAQQLKDLVAYLESL